MNRSIPKCKSQPEVNNIYEITNNYPEINNISNMNYLNSIIKFIGVLKKCPEESLLILEIVTDIEASTNKKKSCEILKLFSDNVKNMNNNQIKYTKRKLNDIIIPKILQNIWIFKNDFEKYDEILGSGFMSVVYLGKINSHTTLKSVAIKVSNPKFEDILKEEAVVMCKLNHPNILQIIGFTVDNFVGIFTECMEQGSLLKVLKQSHSTKQLLNYILDIINGLKYLVDQKYIHRDLCVRNIFVNSSNICKIGDFGLCKYLGSSKCYIDKLQVKGCYSAPEVKISNTCSYASDIYSMGILITDIMHFPDILSENFILNLVVDSTRYIKSLSPPAKYPLQLYNTVQGCLEKIPSDRPNALQIKECVRQCLAQTVDV